VGATVTPIDPDPEHVTDVAELRRALAQMTADRDALAAEVVRLRMRVASAERDRAALIRLRDHLLTSPAAWDVVCAYVVRQWEAAELSEGMASYLLGVDRLTAREVRDEVAEKGASDGR
jgi:hypothetical protein